MSQTTNRLRLGHAPQIRNILMLIDGQCSVCVGRHSQLVHLLCVRKSRHRESTTTIRAAIDDQTILFVCIISEGFCHSFHWLGEGAEAGKISKLFSFSVQLSGGEIRLCSAATNQLWHILHRLGTSTCLRASNHIETDQQSGHPIHLFKRKSLFITSRKEQLQCENFHVLGSSISTKRRAISMANILHRKRMD